MKKGDIIVAVILAVAILAVWGVSRLGKNTDAASIIIEVEGKPYKSFRMSELKKTEKIRIERPEGAYVDIQVDNTGAIVTDVICPDKLCQKTGKIEKVGQSIVCLPNKVVIYIEGEAMPEVDEVTY